SVYWPVRLLKQLARLPHEYSTFLWYGHTIPNGEPAQPYADDTAFCCALIAPSATLSAEAQRFETPDGRSVWIFSIVPIYADEMELKLREGTTALTERLAARGVSDIVAPGRPSSAE